MFGKHLIEDDIAINKLNYSEFPRDVEVYMLRLDEIHPVVSGNKLFKLHYFLEDCNTKGINTIATFGGPYSNHLVATAYAAQLSGLKSIGFVRGQHRYVSPTLNECLQYGMELQYLDRNDYGEQKLSYGIKDAKFYIPEGGYHPAGALGASLILKKIKFNPTHIITAVGTATTLAGISLSADPSTSVIGIPVLKGLNDLAERIDYLCDKKNLNWKVEDNYHFDGYAKYDQSLIDFMNKFYAETSIKTDFVYTGKMMFAVRDLLNKLYFPAGSQIVCIHTGGLQGNRSIASLLKFDV